MRFQAIFTIDADYGGYVVEVPELPGCFSQGKSIEEAEINIRDAIQGILAVMAKNGTPYESSGKTAFIAEVAV